MKRPRLITRRQLWWWSASFIAAACTLAFTAFFILSLYATIEYRHHDRRRILTHSIKLNSGRVEFERLKNTKSHLSGIWWYETYSETRWSRTPRLNLIPQVVWAPGVRAARIPLWLPLLLIAAPTAYLWHTDRRAKPWQCARCRYDLRGLDGGVCPECGTGIASNE